MPKKTMEKALKDLKADHMKIVKIGWKDQDIFINRIDEEKDGCDKIVGEYDAPAMPDFYKAMAALGDHIADLMDFPDIWKERAKCFWLSINYEDDKNKRMGIVVTLSVPMKRYSKPITFNTMHLKEKIPGTAGGGDFMDTTLLDHVLAIIEQAQLYLDGEREQRTLLDKPGKKKRDAEGEDDGDE